MSFTEDDSSADITDIVITELDTIQETTDTEVGNDDVSSETVSITVTLSNVNAGTLSTGGGSVYTSSTGEWYLAATSVTDANTSFFTNGLYPASNYDLDATASVVVTRCGWSYSNRNNHV